MIWYESSPFFLFDFFRYFYIIDMNGEYFRGIYEVGLRDLDEYSHV